MIGTSALLLFCFFNLQSFSSCTDEVGDNCSLEVVKLKNLVKKFSDASGGQDLSKQLQRIEEDLSTLNEIKESVQNVSLLSIKNSEDLLAKVGDLAAAVKEMKNEQNQFVQDANTKNANSSREIVEVKQKIEEVTASGISALTAKLLTLASAVGEIKTQLNMLMPCPPKGLQLTQLANGRTYFFSEGNKVVSWYDARAFCKENKMQLATAKTPEDINYLHQKATQIKSGGYNWWLSASDVGREPGDFRWHDGSQLAKNSPLWREGQPDNFGRGKETCVYIYTGFPAELLDYYCTGERYFICEVPDWCLI